MKKSSCIIILVILFSGSVCVNAQTTEPKSAFERIMAEMKDFRPDTSEVPNDKMTKKIIALREAKGGFNIHEAISFKIEEDRQKKEISAADAGKIKAYFESGNGRRYLDNATIWIYRKYFSYTELKKLVKFYRTDAGRKMSDLSPVIVLQTLAAAEMIKKQIPKK